MSAFRARSFTTKRAERKHGQVVGGRAQELPPRLQQVRQGLGCRSRVVRHDENRNANSYTRAKVFQERGGQGSPSARGTSRFGYIFSVGCTREHGKSAVSITAELDTTGAHGKWLGGVCATAAATAAAAASAKRSTGAHTSCYNVDCRIIRWKHVVKP